MRSILGFQVVMERSLIGVICSSPGTVVSNSSYANQSAVCWPPETDQCLRNVGDCCLRGRRSSYCLVELHPLSPVAKGRLSPHSDDWPSVLRTVDRRPGGRSSRHRCSTSMGSRDRCRLRRFDLGRFPHLGGARVV